MCSFALVIATAHGGLSAASPTADISTHGVEVTGLAVNKTCFPVRFYNTNPHVETLRRDLESVTPTDFASILVTSDHPHTRAQAGVLSARERTEGRGGKAERGPQYPRAAFPFLWDSRLTLMLARCGVLIYASR